MEMIYKNGPTSGRTLVSVETVVFGGDTPVVIAGPCSVESSQQIAATARFVKAAGATMLRGGAFKPRTSPYEFQGLGWKGIDLLRWAGEENGMPTVSEIVDPADLEIFEENISMAQVGARSMQNFTLLKALSKSTIPVLLKRGPSSTINEWLLAAEYLLSGGNPRVVLCERGIRTFETQTRNTLDLSAVALVRELSHLPVIVDPSHGTGRKDIIGVMSKAALAVGSDGLIIEVHPNPDAALSDGFQSLTFKEFGVVMDLIGMKPVDE